MRDRVAHPLRRLVVYKFKAIVAVKCKKYDKNLSADSMKSWFKFYGQEFISDPKMMSLDAVEKSIWVILLCLASSSDEQGVIRYITPERILQLANIGASEHLYKDFLSKFVKLKMLKVDNENGENVIKVKNFAKRQKKILSAYERVKSYRSRKNIEKFTRLNDNEMITHDNANDNARREEKKIYKEKIEKEIPQKLQTFIDKFNITFETKYQAVPSLEANFSYWLGVYTLDQMCEAISKAKLHHFWKDKITPTIMLRRMNPQKENVDYIGEFINYRVASPGLKGYRDYETLKRSGGAN